MHHHLVVAHPNKTSLVHQIADDITDVLRLRKSPVDRFDLYDVVPPHLDLTSLMRYRDLATDKFNAPFVASLRKSTSLIYVFPVWMYNIPSVLKAYFDWAWCPQSTFAFSSNGPISLMHHVELLTVIATHGMSKAQVQASGDASVAFFFDGIGSLLASRDVVTRFDLYGLDNADPATIQFERIRIKGHFSR